MKIRYYSKSGLNFIEVTNDLNLQVTFCDLGASVFKIEFFNECMTRNVKHLEDYFNPNCYYGKTIGRTANRLKGHRFEINGQIYDFNKNEGENVLHGGLNGLSNQRFTPSVKTYGWYIEVRYHYFSKHLESGYPGNINIDVIYLLYKDSDRLDIRYEASSDLDTLFSLTNHSYFTLGDKDISNLELFVRGDNYLKVDRDTLLPLSKEPVSDIYDFRKYRLLSKDIDSDELKGKKQNGYDNFIYFNEINPRLINASLRNDRYRLDVFTNFEGLQIYTSNFEPEFNLDSESKFRDAVAVEPSDSFLNYQVLLKDQKYIRNITYFFLKR